jgi:hypothetical protein
MRGEPAAPDRLANEGCAAAFPVAVSDCGDPGVENALVPLACRVPITP